MPRVSKVHEQVLPQNTLVLDNGGFSIKAGFATAQPSLDECHIIPNCLVRDRARRIWVGSSLEKIVDFGELAFRRPVEKGFIVNWEAEKAIWDSIFIDSVKCHPPETNLLVAEAPNTPSVLQTNCDQMVFEEYEFASYSRFVGPSLNAYNDIAALFNDPVCHDGPAECLLVINSGFSHSTVTPVYKGRAIQQAIRRLDVGGKFLTNHLKEVISLRHYNLVDETHLVNEIKEACCFVSTNFERDLERTWKHASGVRKAPIGEEHDIIVDYVLPDYNSHKQGYMRPHDPSTSAKLKKLAAMKPPAEPVEDLMTLGNERFTVPESLFNPRDIGLRQPGIPEMALQSLSAVPSGLWPAMLANILVVGGNALMKGFTQRL